MDIKNKICNEIENKKQQMINKYDDTIKQAQAEDNFAQLYYLLNKTFNDTKDYKIKHDIGVELLKNNLNHDFFKVANVKYNPSYIIFSNDEFEVWFSKFLSKEIRIKYKKAGSRPNANCMLPSKEGIDIKEKMVAYLNHKSLKNFIKVVKANTTKHSSNKLIPTIIRIVNTYKKCNINTVNKIKNQEVDYEKDQIRLAEEMVEFEGRQEIAKRFIAELELAGDLSKFRKDNWGIYYYGILMGDGSFRYS